MIIHPTKGAFDETRAQWKTFDYPDGTPGEVSIAKVDGLYGMKNAQQPDSPILIFNQTEWDAFIGGVQDGEFDTPGMTADEPTP